MNFKQLFCGVKGAIFDLDGTLVDSLGIWKEIDKRFFNAHNMELPKDYQAKILHLNFMQMAQFTHDEYGFSESAEQIAAIWTQMSEDAYKHTIKIKPGVKEFLQKVKDKGIKISLATANKEDLYKSCLINNGIYDLFDYCLDVNCINSSKTSPLIYQTLTNKMGYSIDECIVFEDILAAVKVAKGAGFKVCAVYDKASEDDLEKIKDISDFIIYDYRDLI